MGTTDASRGTRAGRRPGVALWALAGLTLSALVVGAVLGALRGPAELDPASPEGVTQAYLQAVLDEDYAQAERHLARDLAQRCGPQDFADAWIGDWRTVDLERVRLLGEEAQVTVRFRAPSAPPVTGGRGYGMSRTFVLISEDGAWRLTDQPWPLTGCAVR